jgi:hypothetical protein
MSTCTRCNNETTNLKDIFIATPGGHCFPSLSQPSMNAIGPMSERVCGNCITDNELLLEIGPIAEFALSVLIQNGREHPSPNQNGVMAALETAKAHFIVRRNDSNSTSRNAALRAVGYDA